MIRDVAIGGLWALVLVVLAVCGVEEKEREAGARWIGLEVDKKDKNK